MEMMRTMQLELARVAMQQHVAAPPAETKEKRGAQQSESLSLQVGAQQQQQQPSPPPATMSPPPAATSPGAARRATVDPPKKLKYAEASVARTLEDWLYEVELYCEQLELASTALWIRQTRYVMDRDLLGVVGAVPAAGDGEGRADHRLEGIRGGTARAVRGDRRAPRGDRRTGAHSAEVR